MSNQPPKWIIKWLETICPQHMLDEIEGDLFEYYAQAVETKNRGYAKRKALGFLIFSAPHLLLNRKHHKSTRIDMLRNYIVIAFRNIKRQWGYSLINIFGLAIGLACCILIGLYVQQELSYDKFHKAADVLYRVNLTFNSPQGSHKTHVTPTALLPTVKREFNQVEEGVRVFDIGGFSPVILEHGNVKYQEEKFFYADSTFFDVFSFGLVSGNPEKCLSEPNSVVITKSSARKYFKDQDPLNKVIKVDGTDYTVSGVVNDVPDNSHFKFDFLGSFSSIRASKQEIWGSANYVTFLKLASGHSINKLESSIDEKVAEILDGATGEMTMNFDLISITDIHLRSDIADEMQPQNSITYIYIISVIGLMILVIACINYMNLATARSVDRAREVAMRKVLGAIRKQVFVQFMGESIMITGIATLLALVLVNLVLNPFNTLTGKAFGPADLMDGSVLLGLAMTFITVSFLAGTYPALSLSSFAPNSMLKGSFKRSKTGNRMRQVLVVFQFSISIFLIIGTLVVLKQLDYIKNKKLGYDKDNVITVPTDDSVNDNFLSIKTELERRSDVMGVSIASETPVNVSGGYSIAVPGVTENKIMINAVTVDQDFVHNMGMNLIAGRHFNETDLKLVSKENWEEREYAFIINEQVLARLFLDEDEVIGKQAVLNGRKGRIVGVIKDFHSTSLHRKINPLVLFLEPDQYNVLFIRMQTDNLQKSLLGIEDQWKKVAPDRPFVFEFMDEEYAAMYNNEERLSNVFTVFSGLAIVIACLGLFGLVAFAVEQRNKEISVRKVLGASVPGLFFLISKDFTKLVIIAFLVSAPVAYWLMQEWLMDFEYRISVGVLPILISVITALIIAILTISYQSVKAAMANPVEILRAE